MAVSITFYLIAILPLITSIFIFRNTIPEFDLPSPACTSLTLFLGNKVSYPGNAIYTNSLTSYYSVQGGSLQPSCIVTPESSSDVATAVKTLAFWKKWSLSQCRFAIRSGGHTSAAGAANIHQGVVLDLKLLNQVVVNEEKTVATIGPGARWGDVYTKLDAMELSVVGGRVFDVGIGGLMTGGGMSFFSPRFGWGCDNVENYEVVLASGEIVNASKDENPILWAALKGGSNNFGIVTRFDLKTFKHGKMWGGFVIMPSEQVPKSLDAFAEFAGSSNYDENAALIHSVSFSSYGLLLGLSLEYTIEKEDPEVFRPWIEMEPKFHNSLRTTNLSDIALEMSTFNPRGRRHYWITTTFKNDRAFLHKIVHLFNSTLPTITDIPGLETSFTFQPIPVVLNSKSVAKDGKLNLLGMDGSEGPLVLCLLTSVNSVEADDDRIAKFSTDLFNRIDEDAKAAGLFHPFKYLNYAHPSQEVFGGYGLDSIAQMHSASKMYDPDLLFQACVPGGFKLFKDWKP